MHTSYWESRKELESKSKNFSRVHRSFIYKTNATSRVCDAYMQKVVELETERMQYENNKQGYAFMMPDVFQKSIKMLEAARKQILGY